MFFSKTILTSLLLAAGAVHAVPASVIGSQPQTLDARKANCARCGEFNIPCRPEHCVHVDYVGLGCRAEFQCWDEI
ncbi:hypothetical protein IAQ61_008988 [Plenodomus lingam]|uniref:uncharacterized protein n=1 Tax=Leptosphaeria maculans TaxID=5022 RepID=UPI00332728CB|nr:hypothetical protein IAQ61_008988 [Plenodomus lingam]